MKIAVSSSGKDLDSQIDPRFGRCAYFVIVNTDDMSFETFENKSMTLGGGAGVQAAQFVTSKKTPVVVTGNIGPNAVRALSAAGVKVITGQTGTVRKAVKDYKMGKLTGVNEATVSQHHDMDRRREE